MNTKHFFTPRIAAGSSIRRGTLAALVAVQVLAMVLVAAFSWSSAGAKTTGVTPVEAGLTVEVGKQGVYFGNHPHGVAYVYTDVIKDETMPQRFGHDTDITFRPPALEVRFLNANGGRVSSISAQVYVFFNIGKAELQLWNQSGTGKFSIWYVNESTGRWAECPTFFVNENRDNGTYDRLACLAPGSGFYVLGHLGFDPLLFNPYNESGILVQDFVKMYIPQ